MLSTQFISCICDAPSYSWSEPWSDNKSLSWATSYLTLVEDDLETRLLNILAVTGFPNPHLDWFVDFDSICSNTRDDSEGQIVEILACGLYGHPKTLHENARTAKASLASRVWIVLRHCTSDLFRNSPVLCFPISVHLICIDSKSYHRQSTAIVYAPKSRDRRLCQVSLR